jgi:o-succinylbenzoate---CoA ligase
MERAELKALLRATGCAEERGEALFLHDPREPLDLLQSKIEAPKSKIDPGWLCIRTGGTSGGAKFARHDEHTLSAAVRGFCQHFDLARVNAVDVLPAFHVSGLMARVRCAATDGQHVPWDWKKLEAGETPVVPSGDWVLSLVPTQLQRLLQVPAMIAWLRQFRIVFIGGGPIRPELAAVAARAELPLSLSYGMTETAAMIAALRPEEFLAGDRSCGRALPHAKITVDAAGVIRVMGESVFRGYWPELRGSRDFETDDVGAFDAHGNLRVIGRRDAVIITGGKKVQPAEVEAALLASGEFEEVAVIGVPDAEWGEAVVACYPARDVSPNFAHALSALAAHQRPKRFVAIAAADWPRNAQGKVNCAVLREKVGLLLRSGLGSSARTSSDLANDR